MRTGGYVQIVMFRCCEFQGSGGTEAAARGPWEGPVRGQGWGARDSEQQPLRLTLSVSGRKPRHVFKRRNKT